MINNTRRRIFIDSQSAQLFMGKASEQAYDARSLAIARRGDIVITTSPIDTEYLSYWSNLGFNLPKLMPAGPFQADKCLSTLILSNNEVLNELSKLNKSEYELHFFGTTIGKEDTLMETLGFPAYVNFEFAEKFKNKETAKSLFNEAGIPTLKFVSSNDEGFCFNMIVQTLGPGPYLAKDHYGSGGKALQTIFEFANRNELEKVPCNSFIVESKIPLHGEIAVDWEINNGEALFLRKRNQLSIDDSFCGTKFPVKIENSLNEKLMEQYHKLVSVIISKGGYGPMSCDVLVDTDMNIYWSDLNPRKAASHYVCQAVDDLVNTLGITTPYYLHHQHAHTSLKSPTNFSRIKKSVDELDPFKSRFVLITNPNLFEYGIVDVTAVSFISEQDATDLLVKTFKQISKIGILNKEL